MVIKLLLKILTKLIENIRIYIFKLFYYKNIFNDSSNNTDYAS